MCNKYASEYDNYRLPELLKEETPETIAKRKEALKELQELVYNKTGRMMELPEMES